MNERKFLPVQNNCEKQITYQKNINRFNLAIKNGFYYEAIVIDYAMIEDRLLSMLYHMALRKDRGTLRILKTNKNAILQIVSKYKDATDTDQLGITSLVGKLKTLKCIYRWAAYTEQDYRGNKYLSVLKDQIEGTDIDLFLTAIDDITRWKDYRNEIIHCLLNKNSVVLDEKLEELSLEGMRLARIIDDQVKQLKKGNRIRRSCGLEMN